MDSRQRLPSRAASLPFFIPNLRRKCRAVCSAKSYLARVRGCREAGRAPRGVRHVCLGAHAKANTWLASRSYCYASGVGCGHGRCPQAETRKHVGLLKLLAMGKPRAARAQLADGGKGLSGLNVETCGEDFCSWAASPALTLCSGRPRRSWSVREKMELLLEKAQIVQMARGFARSCTGGFEHDQGFADQ
jgi:hypothetical protein